MNKGLVFVLLSLLQVNCSVKSKSPVFQHANQVEDKSEQNIQSQPEFKEPIETKQFYEKYISTSSDKDNEVLRPLAKIVLNTQHLDDPRLYKEQDLKYSLQVFQTGFLTALQNHPEKVQDIVEKYKAFLSYKCTLDLFTDCKSHVFLRQDSNSSGIMLMLANLSKDWQEKITYLKLALALQNKANGDIIAEKGTQLLEAYVKSKIKIIEAGSDKKLQMVETDKKAIEDFEKNKSFFLNFIKTFNISNKQLKGLQNYSIYSNSEAVLGIELNSKIFMSMIDDKNSDNSSESIKLWQQIAMASEYTNPYSWTNLKKNQPANINIPSHSIDELTKQGSNALMLYQIAKDLNALKPLGDLQNRTNLMQKNPELALQIFENQLKLYFFYAVKKSFSILKNEQDILQKEILSPKDLMTTLADRGNTQLRPLWASFDQVVEHFGSFITQTLGSTSVHFQQFRNFKNKIEVSRDAYVAAPLTIMVIYYIDQKQFKDKISISFFSTSTGELDAALLLSEVLKAYISSFFDISTNAKKQNLNQYQILYALSSTLLMKLPEFFDVKQDKFIKDFERSLLLSTQLKLDNVENYLESLSLGTFDLGKKFQNQQGGVHEILKYCADSRSVSQTMNLFSLKIKTVYGAIENMQNVDDNEMTKKFAALSFYKQDFPFNLSLSEMLEIIRSDIDPVLDILRVVQKISHVDLIETKTLQKRRDKLFDRVMELETKVNNCAIKINDLERSREQRFLKFEISRNKILIAIAGWIDSNKASEDLPVNFSQQSQLSKLQKVDFANEWVRNNFYGPLQTKASRLFEDLKVFKFFELSPDSEILSFQQRDLNLFYRFALWLEEKPQQDEALIRIDYMNSMVLVRQAYKRFTQSPEFKFDSIQYDPNDTFLERKLIGLDYDILSNSLSHQISFYQAFAGILNLKVAKWKMANSRDWDAFAWINCNEACRNLRKQKSQEVLQDAIDADLKFLSYLQLSEDDIEYLKFLGAKSKSNIGSQMKGSNFNITPIGYFVAPSTESTVTYMGVADYLFRSATSFNLGVKPFFSIKDAFFSENGRKNQGTGGEADSTSKNFKAEELYTRSLSPLDLQEDEQNSFAKDRRLIELDLLGKSIGQSQEEQYLASFDKNIDNSLKAIVVAPVLRELELRQTLIETMDKLEKEKKLSPLNLTLTADPQTQPWYVSQTYISRIQKQHSDFHQFTHGAFEPSKWLPSSKSTK